MFNVGETVFVRYCGQVWFGPVKARHESGILTIGGLPHSGMAHKSRCFYSEESLSNAYERAEAIRRGAHSKAAALREEARELELQAEHLRRSAYEAQSSADADADAAFLAAPR